MNPICGILNIDKPAGITSRRVVDRVVKLTKQGRKRLKVGHAGTLDPIATGVLVVCVGPATRLIQYIQEQRKEYRVTFLLGRRSDTDDIEGEVVETPDVELVLREQIVSLLPRFIGTIEQVPPRFSAVHVDGERAYILARQGRDVDLQPRPVVVHRLEIVRFEYPELVLDIQCGSGTYVRSIGRDLGEALGCGAVMSALVRTRIGTFELENAVPFDELDDDTVLARMQPPIAAVAHCSKHVCHEGELELVRHGRPIPAGEGFSPGEISDVSATIHVALLTSGADLAAVATYEPADRSFQPHTVLLPQT